MKFTRLSLTKAKQIELLVWGVIIILLVASRIPMEYPLPVTYAMTGLAVCAAIAVAAITFWPKEKADERAEKNELRASAFIFHLLFALFAIIVLSTLWGVDRFTLEAFYLILGFAALDFMKSLLFLIYERFGA